ncbi:thioredoxin domain-containing protein [Streptomyces sp. TLI_171]|uniref:DsbA family protein n=1 Tax=Streptomyces sp. TLI_171 TaxID=1938859 RepID=UPI000C4D051C|nr:thioredoxin domain-containing protein [Streptomyces sp. TLI_171]RKE17835.1 protein-disulfide isomerase [Streptomyces sp. TLI_171]
MTSTPKNPKKTAGTHATARERLKQAQQAEARAVTRRRRITVGVSVAAAVAVVAGGTAIAVSTAGGADSSTTTAAVTPANTTGTDGTVITYGKADAPHTLAVYEDFRCPVCQAFETSAGQTVQQLADQGQYKIEYHLATFLDNNLGGSGSKTALNAAGAALNEGVDKFKQFHDVLYANQPAESEDGFGDVNHLLDLAEKVPGLKTEAFTKAVTEGAYKGWASKVSTAFNKSGVSGTPTVKLDGKQLSVIGQDGKPLTGDQFTALVQQTIGG